MDGSFFEEEKEIDNSLVGVEGCIMFVVIVIVIIIVDIDINIDI